MKKDVVAPVAASTAVRTGTMGRRPGPRNVHWGADSSTAIDSSAPVDAMQVVSSQEPVQVGPGERNDKSAALGVANTSSQSAEGKTAAAAAHAPAPIIKSVASSTVPVVTEKPPAPRYICFLSLNNLG